MESVEIDKKRKWSTKLLPVLGLLVINGLIPGSADAATPDQPNPENVLPDGTINKKPGVADDRPPSIQLPESLEIAPPVEDQIPAIENQGEKTATPDEDSKPLAPTTPLPTIQRDFSKLPVPVARMRELIMAAARAGDFEALRPLIGSGEDITMLSLGGIDGDPIEFFKSLSGDEDGLEIMAILLEVLEAGYVRLDAGTDNELYVWPYFFAWPLDKLTPVQKVEMFRILTAGDYEDMRSFGGYIFYRVGITPEGRWRFFVAGD